MDHIHNKDISIVGISHWFKLQDRASWFIRGCGYACYSLNCFAFEKTSKQCCMWIGQIVLYWKSIILWLLDLLIVIIECWSGNFDLITNFQRLESVRGKQSDHLARPRLPEGLDHELYAKWSSRFCTGRGKYCKDGLAEGCWRSFWPCSWRSRGGRSWGGRGYRRGWREGDWDQETPELDTQVPDSAEPCQVDFQHKLPYWVTFWLL